MIPYTFSCILLSGMPCTGKDTITHQLVERDSVFALFKKHRAEQSLLVHQHDDTYIHVSPEKFWSIAHADGFIQFHQRYGRMYGVSKEEYHRLIDRQKIPIIHVGKYENLHALRDGGLQRGLSLLLWADRDIVRSRLIERHKHRSDGIEERLIAYDQEVEQLKQSALMGELDFDGVFVNNSFDLADAVTKLCAFLQTYNDESKQYARKLLSQLLGL